MIHITTYSQDRLNETITVRIPYDFTNYRHGKYLTEIEITIEPEGTTAGQIDITAKRIGSTDDLVPFENSIFLGSELPKSVTYFGSFSEITATPDATFIASAGSYKIIINAGETY